MSENKKYEYVTVPLLTHATKQILDTWGSEGWELVQSEEVPEMLHSSFVRDTGRYQGAVCRGDLALAKMPQELADSRQEFYENRSREMVAAVNAQLMNSNDSRMPIQNNSTTKVSRGKVPKFQD